ncbi:MAG: sialidase family protein [Planctomycetota bacterium]|nr:sialidase family protein [Planctomycetota bacterium]
MSCAEENVRHTRVYTQGIDGYATYRIPAIETAQDGSLLAIAEGRKYNWEDPGDGDNDIDLVMKRSTDGGLTWSPLQIIEDPGEKWSAGNPATLLDKDTGRVWLFYIRVQPKRAGQQTFARTSDDHGVTWSDPIDLTKVAGVVGPGGPIRTRKGVLVAPTFGERGVWAFYSEDHGKTWHAGEPIPDNPGGNENQLVELSDGKILMDYRQLKSAPHRWMATSEDGGKTWSKPRPGLETPTTTVACAIESFTTQSQGADVNRIVWTGPRRGRKNMVIRVTYDDAKTFPVERLFAEGRGGYSDITILDDESIGILWEGGGRRDSAKWSLTFTRVTQEFLEP